MTYDPATGNYVLRYEGISGKVHEVTLEPSTKIDPEVQARVTASPNSDLYRYAYKVSNGASSKQQLYAFRVTHRAPIEETERPAEKWTARAFGERPIFSWANYKDPYGRYHPLDGIAPDSSVSGFVLESPGLPTVVQAYFKGARSSGLGFPEEPPSEIEAALDTLDRFPHNTVPGKTIGPRVVSKPLGHAPSSTPTPAALRGRAGSLPPRRRIATRPIWIRPPPTSRPATPPGPALRSRRSPPRPRLTPAVEVVLVEAPAWIEGMPAQTVLGALGEKAEAAARPPFDVARAAPMGEIATLRFSIRSAGTVIAEKQVRLQVAPPTAMRLRGNSPNPFAGPTAVGYELPQAAQVRLEVYDVLGRRVAVLDRGLQQAGFRELRWLAWGQASGVYSSGSTSTAWLPTSSRATDSSGMAA